MSDHVCLIFFLADSSNLAEAQAALTSCGLTVKGDRHKLICFRDNSPKFTVYLNSGLEVQTEALEIAEENPNYRSRLKNCNIRFEICFEELSEVLTEINTSIDIQITLQDIARGIVFTSWNGILEL